MDSVKCSKFIAFLLVIVQLGCIGTSAKSLFQDSQPQQPQVQYNGDYIQQNSGHSGMNYPQFPGVNEEYQDQQSEQMDEDIMPVKNSQFVPVESSSEESPEDGANMYIPQRQVALNLNKYWNNNNGNGGPYQPSNTEDVEDEGDGLIEEHVVTEYSAVKNVPQINQEAPEPVPAVATKAKVNKPYESKLTVESRKFGNTRIAVLVDDNMRRARQERSMMTLSREDENDSEYDDLDSSPPKNSTQVSTSTRKP
ncbi:unnamed protein product [Orchesella dallaii]|uniref:Uncharacterized protein n=1 Tax=Orchesella dallaii TaxID=48710 RepID=A0ABP1Q5B7_9HEXA